MEAKLKTKYVAMDRQTTDVVEALSVKISEIALAPSGTAPKEGAKMAIVSIPDAKGEQWRFRVNVHEDNTTTVQIVRSGKSQSMKTLERNAGISVRWLHERILSGDYNIYHCRTIDMSADIYTKATKDVASWRRLRKLINVYTPAEIKSSAWNPDAVPHPDQVISECANKQYQVLLYGTSQDNDLRKPVKLKAPKKKKKNVSRPNPNRSGVSAVVTDWLPDRSNTSVPDRWKGNANSMTELSTETANAVPLCDSRGVKVGCESVIPKEWQEATALGCSCKFEPAPGVPFGALTLKKRRWNRSASVKSF